MSKLRARQPDLAVGEVDQEVDVDPAELRPPGRLPLVMRRPSAGAPSPDARRALARAQARTGEPLSPAVRAKLERALGVDLGAVRVHTDDAAAFAAAAVAANAYTVGQDIYFAAGAFDPGSPVGFHLLVHEVAHTVQQGGAPTTVDGLVVSTPGESAEREAEQIADDVAAVADAIRPRDDADPAIGARLDGAQAAVREHEAPGALPLQIAHHVSGRLMRDGDDGGAGGGGAGGDGGTPVGPTSGTISDETFEPPEAASGCDLHGPGCAGNHQVRVNANLSYTPVVTQTSWSGGSVAYDSISGSGVTATSTVGRGGGIPGSAFGKATPKFSTKGVAWTVDGSTVNVTGNVLVDVRWDVQSRGRVSIEKPDDSYLGPGNYMQAFYDLLDGMQPKREVFWVQSFTETHEQFHVQEYIANTQKETANQQSWLSSQKITIPKSDSDKSIQDQLEPILKDLAKNVGNAVLDTFASGGEARAYAPGAGAYATLAQGIKAHGDSLGWDKQSKGKGDGMVPPAQKPTDDIPDT